MGFVKNTVINLHCDALGAELEGICRCEGIPVFVPGMLPGESADVRIEKVHPRYAFGKAVSPPSPSSPCRKEPDCPVFPRCGGCQGRHMTYQATLDAKREQVESCFQRIGHLSVPVRPVVGMDHPFQYRNKTALPVGGTSDQPVLGFYAPRSHFLIPVTECPNAMIPSPLLCQDILRWMKAEHVEPYLEKTHTGMLRHVVIRVNRKGESMVTLVIKGKKIPHPNALADMLFRHGCISLYLNENPDPTNVILGHRFSLIRGNACLEDTLCGLTFDLSPASFFQVNPEQAEKLYNLVLSMAEIQNNEQVCDVYCGTGTISLLLAMRARQVTGIEVVPEAIENARNNARRNHIENITFHVGAAEEVLPRLVAQGYRPDVLVVDPPRKGMQPEVIQAISEVNASRIVYVSCNPATLARDAALLAASGYSVNCAVPVDMFCWTSGVEAVCLLSKVRSAPHIDIDPGMTELDVTTAETNASYKEITDYVLEHTGLEVSCLHIAQVKEKHGIIERDYCSKPKGEDNKVPQCPPEKEKAIEGALRHFQMI